MTVSRELLREFDLMNLRRQMWAMMLYDYLQDHNMESSVKDFDDWIRSCSKEIKDKIEKAIKT